MPPVITVENIGKKYVIGKRVRGSYTALRDVLADAARDAVARLRSPADELQEEQPETEEFWALQELTFAIEQGERVGIIGRNGAGKSTLLKLLSRVTDPTVGRISLTGRVASLLEVGTGFHPELTGRENIYLNGAVLGMKRTEIRERFDEIVAFAEVERFLETPVKRYSSGMYLRLAFAVAAHLDPEILLVDEVLAVGDASFQKRCLGKIDAVAREGRTVFFVSHNMAAIENLCNRCFFIDQGRLAREGNPTDVIAHYLATVTSDRRCRLADRRDRVGDGRVRFTDTWIEDQDGARVATAITGTRVKIVMMYEVVNPPVKHLSYSVSISTLHNVALTNLSNRFTGDTFPDPMPTQGRIECVIDKLPLNVGNYSYNLCVQAGSAVMDWIENAGIFSVECGDYYGTGHVPDGARLLLIDHGWKLTSA